MDRTPTRRTRRRQSGQSMTEYAVLCAVLGAALFLPIPGQNMAAGQFLAAMLQQMYSSLSYFLSLP
jgi:hypothetical protein